MQFWSGYCSENIAPKDSDIKYYDVNNKPFEIFGICEKQKDNFYRLPHEVAANVSGGVLDHSHETAGVRVRFATNSPYVALKSEFEKFSPSPHVTFIASKGFDMYVEKDGVITFNNSFYPPLDTDLSLEGIARFNDTQTRNFILNFPIGTPVKSLKIGIKEGSVLVEPDKYKISNPIVFYGSSITQGFAASRPGNIYENFISRSLNADYINLGFSGCAMGEKKMAEYISNLSMSAFVLDYDHNAPSIEHLKNTHYDFYKTVRDKNPKLPIILVSRPERRYHSDIIGRRKVILDTYMRAVNDGDTNIHFVDGTTFFPLEARYDCTVDDCHPNDMGMYNIAKGIERVLTKIKLC